MRDVPTSSGGSLSLSVSRTAEYLALVGQEHTLSQLSADRHQPPASEVHPSFSQILEQIVPPHDSIYSRFATIANWAQSTTQPTNLVSPSTQAQN
jgi:hypothetical protein